MSSVILHNASSVNDVIDIITRKKRIDSRFMTFRGQASVDFELSPKLFRNDKWEQSEGDMVKELLCDHPSEFSSDTSMLDKLVRMAHYGLPTRLLDVTGNILIALYFAVMEKEYKSKDGSLYIIMGKKSDKLKFYDSDTISVLSNLSNLSQKEKYIINNEAYEALVKIAPLVDRRRNFNEIAPVKRLVQFIKNEKPYFENNIYFEDVKDAKFVLPKRSNRRIISQNGSFIIFGLTNRMAKPAMDGFQIEKIIIQSASKEKIIRHLELMGINDATVFPEMDKLARIISDKYS